MWLSLTNDMKPRVRRTNQMFTIWNPQPVVSESISILVPGLGLVLGHLQTVQTQIRLKFRYEINETVLSPRSGLFSQPTVRDNLPTSVVSALIIRKITLVTSCLHSCTPRPFWKVRAISPIYSRSFSEGRQNLLDSCLPKKVYQTPLSHFGTTENAITWTWTREQRTVMISLAQGLEIYIYIFWLIELCG